MKRFLLALLSVLVAMPAHAQSTQLVNATPYAIDTGTTRQIIFAGTPNTTATASILGLRKRRTLIKGECGTIKIPRSIIAKIKQNDPSNGIFELGFSYYYLSNYRNAPVEILKCINGVYQNSQNAFWAPNGDLIMRWESTAPSLQYFSTEPIQKTVRFDMCGMGRMTLQLWQVGGESITLNGELKNSNFSETPNPGFVCKQGVLYQPQ